MTILRIAVLAGIFAGGAYYVHGHFHLGWGAALALGLILAAVLSLPFGIYPMSRLRKFFHGNDAAFGVFYPDSCILASFRDLAGAEHAKSELNEHGLSEEDVIAVSGNEVIRFAEGRLRNDGPIGALMTNFSRWIGTEASYTDDDLAAARQGAAFLAVHCSTEKQKNHAWTFIEPRHPLAAHYYSSAGVEHLVG